MRSTLMSATAVALFSSMTATAQVVEHSDDAPKAERRLDQISVLGSAQEVTSFAGSAAYLEVDVLDVHADSDIHRILNVVPGINIQEEDGFGLRPNIGLRGTGLDRSSKITLMEDGVLIAPAPYAAPSAYYFPRVGRMSAVEVVKGPSAIKYGPRTQGGSINFVSSNIPDTQTTRLKVQAGEYGASTLMASTGGQIEANGLVWGGLLEATRDASSGFKSLDIGGDTGYLIEDYVGKVSVGSAEGTQRPWQLEIKGQYSDESSDETYLGLTREDYEAQPYRRYTASSQDEMSAEHSEISARFSTTVADFDITALAYRTTFGRDWFKLDRVEGVSISGLLADPAANPTAYSVLAGADSSIGGLRLKHNNRDYEATGIQFIAGRNFETGPATHAVEIGVRVHEDQMDRFQWVEYWTQSDNALTFSSATEPGSDSNRIDSAQATAIHIKDDISIGRWTVSPGLRFEDISLKRENWGGDITRSGAPAISENNVDVMIPGLNISYEPVENLFLFGGVHKGFSPPAPGSTQDESEEAVNYEAGLRWSQDTVSAETVFFYNDYENLLGACTNSTGGGCEIGDQFNGGKVEVKGLEASLRSDIAALAGADRDGWSAPATFAVTWTDATFQSAFSSDFDPWGDVVTGDALPYIPEWQINFGIGLAHGPWSVDANVNWQDDTRAIAGQGPIAEDELISSRVLTDLALRYDITDNLRMSARVKNLTDETYIAALRPSGLRPGLPRQVLLGLEARF